MRPCPPAAFAVFLIFPRTGMRQDVLRCERLVTFFLHHVDGFTSQGIDSLFFALSLVQRDLGQQPSCPEAAAYLGLNSYFDKTASDAVDVESVVAACHNRPEN